MYKQHSLLNRPSLHLNFESFILFYLPDKTISIIFMVKIVNLVTMQSKSKNVTDYLKELPADRLTYFSKLRDNILKHLPKGFQEGMGYGMICYSVPHSLFPAGYHCDPTLPLGFMSIACQKNFIALYHMGIYADPKLLDWFVKEYPKHCKTKLDMGKSCIRFKKMEDIPYDLISELCKKMTPQDWITRYEKMLVIPREHRS